MRDLTKETITLARHIEIVKSIYAEFNDQIRQASIMLAHPGLRGHRYHGERCVWCHINYLDEIVLDEAEQEQCVGPAEGEWDEDWWPLAEIDTVVRARRGWPPEPS